MFLQKIRDNQFLLEELVKRDFKKKYKRTVLGMLWSVLSPLLTLLVMRLVFTEFFGRNTPFYTTYIFSGNIVFSFFNECTSSGMSALVSNRGIFSKVKLPKYLFVLSSTFTALLNFLLTLLVFFLFAAFDGIRFSLRFVLLLFPVLCEYIFCIGTSLILSAMQIFFRDTAYLYRIFIRLLSYLSAVFYDISGFSAAKQRLFLLNPIYVYIKYVRIIVIDGAVPGLSFCTLSVFYAMAALVVGIWVYRKCDDRFMYYV